MSAPEETALAEAPSPYVFVVGCPRSGTTLLQRMLDAHPDLAVANDSHFVPLAVQAVAPELARGQVDDVPFETHRKMIEWAVGYRRFERLGLPEESVARASAPETAPTYQRFVAAIYRELAAQRGKSLGGEKTPDYVRTLSMLHRLFPRTRIVHIIRDGREVALSALEWAHESKGPGRFPLWKEEPVAVAAQWWRWQVRLGREEAKGLPEGASSELRYEDLVNRPGEQIALVAGRLELDTPGAVDAMLAYHVGKEKHGRGLSAKSAWLPPTPGLRDFRKEMDPRSLALFELLAGDLLEELGYARAADPLETSRDELIARAEECRSRWREELALRVRRKQRELAGSDAKADA